MAEQFVTKMGVRILTVWKQVERERREHLKSGRNALPRWTMLIVGTMMSILGTSSLPLRVFAAGSLETSATQVKVGTLPLLAALGFGIAVAVGSVIAFLQMTARGKEMNDSSTVVSDDNESTYEDTNIDDWDDEDTTPNSEYEDNSLTDYTIPITKLLTYPDHAEAANDEEPRLYGVEGEHAGNSYRVLNRRLTFGRDPAQCVILFPYEAGDVSRMHCTLRFIEESRLFLLEDHGSSNGTFLADGERLQPGRKVELRTGERFSLSGNKHIFEVQDIV
jgi:hypothetical protein